MRKMRIFALALCICLVLSAVPAAVFAAGDEMHISTPSQLRELSEKCRFDSWSVGKTFVLDCDIDLGGEEFEPIPSFGGTFEGGGHSISGLAVKSGGSAVGGLFRFVQSGGIIRELNVEGSIEPEMNAESFGGIAGENSGTISECSFSGTVSGSTEIGGIVGVNTSGGVLKDCRSLASVSGEHYTGGIVGRNLGEVLRCTNLGPVNTTNPEFESDTLDIDWTHLNSTENFSAHTDTGGIAGFSQGTLEQCVNRGNVGYPHVGYNVGGIAGRQAGFVTACRNFGEVNGRKDVGGVIGQMVPDIRMHFSGNAINELSAEMAKLSEMLDTLISDVQGSSNEISGILSAAGAYLQSAGQSAGVLGDAIGGFIDGNIETVNDFIALVEKYVGGLGEIAGHIEDCFAHLSAAAEHIDVFLNTPGNAESFPEIFADLSYAKGKIEEAEDMLKGAQGLFKGALGDLNGYYKDLIENTPLPENADDVVEGFIEVSVSAAEKAKNALNLMVTASKSVRDAVDNGLFPAMEKMAQLSEAGELSATLEKLNGELGAALDSLESASGDLERWIYNLSREDGLAFEVLGEDFMEEADRMEASLAGLSGQMEKLNTAVNSSVNVMGDDLRAVNEQFFKVMDCFLKMLETSSDTTALYEDMSEEEMTTATDGKVQKSENRGAVAGDVNTGGLVGTIGIEYDLDPEEDISVSGSAGGTFKYFTNAVLLASVNFESVTGKKDCVGGAVGYMDLGLVYGCENYGDISSSSGDYVGGIAGQSAAAVRNSWSLCALSGRDYVGGIAGSVMDVSSCRSLVRVDSSGGWKGAVAGEVLGEAKDNYFVSDSLGGIDGVSYAGKAEPQSYAEFVAAEDVPGEFENFTLTFATDSMLVKSIPFSYGKSIDITEIPPVPEKEGYVGEWERYNFSNLSFSDTVMAVYTPYDTVVAAENTVGKRSVLLLEGSFIPETVPVLESCADVPENCLEAWTVNCSGLVEEGYTVRYLAPESDREPEIWLLGDEGWQSVESTAEGSYLLFEGSGESFSFAAVEREKDIPMWPFVLTGAVAVVLIAAVLILRLRANHRAKARQTAG